MHDAHPRTESGSLSRPALRPIRRDPLPVPGAPDRTPLAGEELPDLIDSVNSEGPKPDPQKVLGETEDAAAPDPWTPNRGLEAPSAPGDICGAVLERPSAASLPDYDRLRGRARRVTDKRRESWTPTTTAVVDRTDTSIVVEQGSAPSTGNRTRRRLRRGHAAGELGAGAPCAKFSNTLAGRPAAPPPARAIRTFDATSGRSQGSPSTSTVRKPGGWARGLERRPVLSAHRPTAGPSTARRCA